MYINENYSFIPKLFRLIVVIGIFPIWLLIVLYGYLIGYCINFENEYNAFYSFVKFGTWE